MSISGKLKTIEVSDLLQWLAHGGKTGTLVLGNGQVDKRILFREGHIISTASSDPKEYLGHFLVSRGLIDEVQLAHAMEMQETNRMLLGKILVTIDAISENDLNEMLLLKLEETIYEVFTWPEGEFRFVDGDLPDFTLIPMAVNINALILEGVQRADDWRVFRERIASNQAVPVAVRELSPPSDDPMAGRILHLVNDDRSIEEIALHSHASEFHVCRVLYEALVAGSVKLVRPRHACAPRVPAAEEPAVDSAALLARAERHLAEGAYEEALRHLRAALSLEPHDPDVQQHVRVGEEEIEERIVAEGLAPDAVPRLALELEDLAMSKISPQEGFVLSRIDGSYDIQTLTKITPMTALETLLAFRRLVSAGYIELGPPVA